MQLQQDTLRKELQERTTEISQLTTQQREDAIERNKLRSSVDVLLGIKATSDQHMATLESQLASMRAQRDQEVALRAKESTDAAALAQTLTEQFTVKLADASIEHVAALATTNSRIAELEKLLADAKEDSRVLTERTAALATKDSRIAELQDQLTAAAIQCVHEVTTATAAAQQDASLALSLALTTAKQEADSVIAQLQLDMNVLQGCVDERNSALVTAQQDADLCILQMDEQLRLAKAEIAVLLEHQTKSQSASVEVVDEKEKIIRTLQDQIDTLEKETERLSTAFAESTTNHQNQGKELSSLELQLRGCKSNDLAVDARISDLERKLEETDHSHSREKQLHAELRLQYQHQQMQIAQQEQEQGVKDADERQQFEELKQANVALLTQLHDLTEAKITSDNLFDELKAEALAVERHIEQIVAAKDTKINALEMAVDVYTGSQLAVDKALFIADEQAQSHKRDCLAARTELADALARLDTSVSEEKYNRDIHELQMQIKIQRDLVEASCTQQLAQMTIAHEAILGRLTEQLADTETTLSAARTTIASDQLTLASQAEELTCLSSTRMRLSEKDHLISDLESQVVLLTTTKGKLVGELQEQLAEKERLSKDVESKLNDVLQTATQQCAQLTEQVSNLQAELTSTNATKTSLMTELSTLQTELDREKQELAIKASAVDSLTSALAVAKEAQAALVTDLQTQLRVADDAHRDLLNTLAETTTAHDARINDLKTVHADQSSAAQKEHDKCISDLQALLSSSQLSQSESLDRIATLEASMVSWKDQVEELNNRIASMTKQQIDALQAQANDFLQRETVLTQERDQLIIQTTTLQEELGSNKCNDLALEAQVDDLELQLELLRAYR